MILIVSQSYQEMSTDQVIDWIDYLGGSFIRINGDEICQRGGIKVTINKEKQEIEFKEISDILNKQRFNVGWYRRWSYESYEFLPSFTNLGVKNSVNIINNIISNNLTIKRFLLSYLQVNKWLTEPTKLITANNKAEVLCIARKFKLEIPSTIICSKKSDLLSFLNQEKKIITKDLSIPFNIQFSEGYFIDSYTTLFTEEDMVNIPEIFAPTLFQAKIEKEFEIRSFFIDNHFFSMAIISQEDQKTMIDFRNYNLKDPNRFVPYKIPSFVEAKLRNVFDELQINKGSVDLVKDINGNYIFLEINPIGQFGMTSIPCNYNLEKKIAEYLIKNDQ